MNALLKKNFISTKEASSLSGYNADYLSRLCREKKISGSQIGRTWLVERESLEAFMAAQIERKIELAEGLAREREREYRNANAPVSQMTSAVEKKTRLAANSLMAAFASVRLPKAHLSLLTGRSFATAMTALVLAGSVAFAGSGAASRMGAALAEAAFAARASVIAAAQGVMETSLQRRAALGDVAARETGDVQDVIASASSTGIEIVPAVLRDRMAYAHAPIEMHEIALSSGRSFADTLPEALTFSEAYANAEHVVLYPAESATGLSQAIVRAYDGIGQSFVSDAETILSMHARMINASGEMLFSFGMGVRDTGTEATRGYVRVGQDILAFLQDAGSAYESGIYAYVVNVDAIPRSLVAGAYALGDSLGNVLASGIQSAPRAYESGVLAFAQASAGAGEALSGGSFAFGAEARGTVLAMLDAEDRAIAYAVHVFREGLGEAADTSALVMDTVPDMAADSALEVAGTLALNAENSLESVSSASLPASAFAALDFGTAFPEFLKGTLAMLAEAARDTFNGILGPLAGFFGTAEDIGLAVIPDAPFYPDSSVAQEAPAAAGDTTVVNNAGPVTVIRNEYPSITYGGVPIAYVDAQIDRLRSIMERSVRNAREDDDGITTISGESGSNVALSNSTFTGGTITDSTLSVLDTTVNGVFTVNGNTVFNGSFTLDRASTTALSALDFLTVGRTATTTIRGDGAASVFAGGLESISYIAGPYILATSTTATSAFSGNIAVGRSATFGTSAADLLTVNSTVASHLIPSANNAYDLGSPGNYWRRGYMDELIVNNLSAASSSIGGTVSNVFAINSDNATNDTEDGSIVFYRGIATPNALIAWNSTVDRFEFNMPVFSADGIFTNATSTSFGLGGSTFTSLLGAGLQNSGGTLTVDNSALAGNFFRHDGNSFGTSAILGTNDAQSLQFETGNAPRMTITSAGNIGIGTTNPSAPLGIVTTNAIGLQLRRDSTTTNNSVGIGFRVSTTETSANLASITAIRTNVPSNGDHDLAFSTSVGASLMEAMRISSVGYVGIGTTSPSSLFSVQGGSSSMSFNGTSLSVYPLNGAHGAGRSVNLIPGDTTIALDITGFVSGTASIRTSSSISRTLVIGNAGTGGMTTAFFSGTGPNLVGIGTASPVGALDIKNAIVFDSSVPVEGALTEANYNSYVTAATSTSRALALAVTNNNYTTAGMRFVDNNSAGNAYVSFLTGDATQAPSERLRITNAGNVGIGTATPSTRLHVYSSDLVAMTVERASGADIAVALKNLNGNKWAFGHDDSQDTFSIAQAGDLNSGNQRLVITSAGNVGIGTTTPASKLVIEGGSGLSPGIDINTVDTSTRSELRFMNNGPLAALVQWRGTTNASSPSTLRVGTTLAGSQVQLLYGAQAVGLTLSSLGNVGIGTSTPSTLLSVSGSAPILTINDTRDATFAIGDIMSSIDFRSNDNSSSLGGALRTQIATIQENTLGSSQGLSFSTSLAGVFGERLRISSAGNIGIGTTSPARMLTVAGTVPLISLYQSSAGSIPGLVFGGLGGGDAVGQIRFDPSVNDMYFVAGGSEKVRLMANGNVGIGTTSPVSKLHVTTSDAFTGFFESTATNSRVGILVPNALGNAARLSFGVGTVYNSSNQFAHIEGVVTQTSPLKASLAFSTNRGGIISEAMRIDDVGNIGIGTTTPFYVLDVQGSGSNQVRISSTNTLYNILDMNAYGAGGAVQNMLRFNTSGSTNWGIGVNQANGNALTFASSALLTSSPRMVLTTAGNLGIGTTTPTRQLSIYANQAIGSILGLDATGQTGGKEWVLQSTSGGASQGQGKLLFRNSTDGVDVIALTSTGNVGIGTSSPSSMLSVAGTGIFTGTAAVPLVLERTSAGSNVSVEFRNLTGSWFAGQGRIGAGNFAIGTSNDIGASGFFQITPTGNIGIGTTSPYRRLSVSQSAGVGDREVAAFENTSTGVSAYTGLALTSDGTTGFLRQFGPTYSGSNTAGGLFLSNTDTSGILGMAAPGTSASLRFIAGGGGFGTERMRIDGATGNIGIGTTTPGYPLVVNIGATGISAIAIANTNASNGTSGTGIAFLGPNAIQTGGIENYRVAASNYATRFYSYNGTLSEAMRITSTGNVGIGTSSPVSALSVGGSGELVTLGDTIATTYMSFARGSLPGGRASFGYDAVGNAFVQGALGKGISFNVNNNTVGSGQAMILTSGGNVGIGTTSPASRLTVESANNSTGGIRLTSNAGTDANRFVIYPAGNSGTVFQNLSASGGTNFADSAGNSNIYINHISGNIGIGTTSPAARLSVSGTILGDSDIQLVRLAGTGQSILKFSDTLTGPASNNLSFGTTGSGDVITHTFGTERMRVVGSSGFVGIGTTTPAAKLHVSGGNILLDNNQSLLGYNTVASGVNLISINNTNTVSVGASSGSMGDLMLNAGTAATMRFTAGGAERMRITAAGNIGIGTTSPATNLHISGVGTQTFRLENQGLGNLSMQATGGDGRLYTSSGPLLLQPSAGNVGIGTTSPQEALNVYSTAGNTARFTGSTLAKVLFEDAGVADASSPFGYIMMDDGILRLGNANRSGLTTTGSGDRLVISAAGNVGIGTTSPAAKLSVAGDGYLTGNLGVGLAPSTARIDILQSADNNGSGFIIRNSANTGAGRIWEDATNQVRIDGNSGATGNIILNGAGAGYVGIGTTSPAQKLHVDSGTVRVSASNGQYVDVSHSGTSGIMNSSAGGMVIGPSLRVTNINLSSAGITGSAGSPLRLGANGVSDHLYIATSGNVGIGTTTPNARLTVASSGSDGLNLDADTASAADSARMFFSNATAGQSNVIYNSGGTLQFSTGATPGSSTGTVRFRLGVSGFFAANSTGGIILSTATSGTAPAFAPNRTDATTGLGANAAGVLSFITNATEKMTITNAGNVGIGTSSPSYPLDVVGTGQVFRASQNAGSGQAVFTLSRFNHASQNNEWGYNISNAGGLLANGSLAISPQSTGAGITSDLSFSGLNGGYATGGQLVIKGATGNIGIGTSTPTAQLHTTGTVRFSNFAAGSLQTDADGNVTASSDERLKDIDGSFTRGLADLMAVNPIQYHWKSSTGFDTQNTYTGFSAQNVQGAIPEAVDTDNRGYLTLSDRPILATAVNAIKELGVRTDGFSLASSTMASRVALIEARLDDETPKDVLAESLTVSGASRFSNVSLEELAADSVSANAFLADAADTLPDEVLTGGKADLYKMASRALTGTEALTARADLFAARLDAVETRVAALESATSSPSENLSGAIGLTAATLKSALSRFGILIEDGIAQFNTLVFRQLAVAKDADGTSSAGNETIIAGNTVLEVDNAFLLPTSKIFVTFTSPISGAWYLSEKKEGSFRVTLSEAQGSDVSFDYFILQTEGQLASPASAPAPVSSPAPAPAPTPLPPVFPEGGTSTSTPEAGTPPPAPAEGDTTPPSISLNGAAASDVPQGGAWSDPGASATDAVDGDLTGSIQVSGSVDTATPGLYTVSYAVSDAAGNQATVSRVVTVQAAPAPEPAPVPEPAV